MAGASLLALVQSAARGLTAMIAFGAASAALAQGSQPLPGSSDWAGAGEIVSGVAAELGCAGVFVMGRTLGDAERRDVHAMNSLLGRARLSLGPSEHEVSAEAPGAPVRTAYFRPGIGCTLLGASTPKSLDAQKLSTPERAYGGRPGPWPLGDAPFTPSAGEGARALDAAVEAAFAGDNGPGKLDTRAIIVVRRGRIVAEKYASGFDAHSRFLGWSMSKSVTSAMIGALVGDGRLSLDGPSGVPEWQGATDPRKSITLRNMLQMADGLAFDDGHVPGDETTMLYARADMAAYAAARPTLYPPGVKWSYSSGETLMIARLATATLGGGAEAQAYLYKRIFAPLHMDSAVLEADETGVPVGSSYVYATARDWARFGLLYLDDGVAPDHRRVLSHDWVMLSRTPNGLEPQGLYGAQFWVNRGPPGDPSLRMMKDLPTDTYFALGHSDEIVAVIPSRQTVIVRLGWTPDGQHFDANGVFSRILAALPTD